MAKHWRSVKFFLGTAQLSRAYGVVSKNDDDSRESPERVVLEAELLGFSGVDTAPVYGAAEEQIGRSGTVLAVYTKLNPALSVDDSIRQSCSALQREFLDGVYLHEEFIASRRQRELLKLLRGREAQDVGDVGVSIYSVDEFHRANANPDVGVIQLPYNVFDQRFNSDFLAKNLDPAKRVFGRSIFLQGVLLQSSFNFPSAVAHLRSYKVALENATKRSDLDDLDVALGYAMTNHALSGIIVGTSSITELREISLRKLSMFDKDLSSVLNFGSVPPWSAVDPRKWS